MASLQGLEQDVEQVEYHYNGPEFFPIWVRVEFMHIQLLCLR